MTLFEKSLQTLEFPAVLQMLAQQAVSETAKERALALAPAENIYECRRMMAETTAAKKMMETRTAPSFSGVKDVRSAVSRADMGGVLNTRELLDIAGVLRAARTVSAYADGSERTEIDYMFSALHANKYLEEKITNSIAGDDEIADAASTELASIRRQMRITSSRIREALQKIISSSTYAKALQEPIITMRSDRFVVPVKAEYKSAVPGLVHDISSSGATLFIEPMQSVNANNELRELQAKEKKEIERILMELSAEAASFGADISADFELLTALDLVFARAKLSYAMNASEPEMADGGGIVLRHARHPLLPKQTAVPMDLRLGDEYDTLVITGPNTGGKTVSLKTLGLMCVMARAGLHIPADDGSRIPDLAGVLADIGDEQSIEQSLSTFSAHITNIVGILEEADEKTLLLFDELGAGTDPVEGAALAVSIIEHAREKGALVAATTHYAELKLYATSAEGVQNASCEFDVATLRPTYRLITGIPGKSNAFAIAERLGLPEEVIEDAKKRIDQGSSGFEEVVSKLESQRSEMEKEELRTRQLMLEAERNAKEAEEYKKKTEKEKDRATLTARREAEKIIEQARRAAAEVYDELARLRKEAAKDMDWQRTNEARVQISKALNAAEQDIARGAAAEEEQLPPPSERPVQVGDTVLLLGMNIKGKVEAVSADRMLTVNAGLMKITVREDEVRLTDASKGKGAPPPKSAVTEPRMTAVSPEIDLRGMNAEDAVITLEKYIDNAVMARLESVRIIHGKGTGVLRAAVHSSLKMNKSVKKYRLGRYGEGETGVTIAELG